MTPATNPMRERHAFLWQRLRDWLAEALHNHANSLEYRTRDQLIPLRIWLTLIENLLRRLILMAASTEKVDVKPQWAPEPKPEPEPESESEPAADTPAEPEPPTRKSNASHFRFRLYGIHWPRKANANATETFTGAAPPTATCTRALITIRIDIRDPLLNVGERPQRRTKSSTRSSKHPATKRIRATKLGPDLTPEDFIALVNAHGASGASAEQTWLEMQKDIARQNRADLAEMQSRANEADTDWRDDEPAERVDESEVEPAPTQPEPEPELISTQPLMDRLAAYAELINNPDKLIKRAARLFARRREIALKLSRLARRKKTGLLANSRHLYGTLIPLDAEFRLAMEYFAVSYVEDDSS
jgi:hypothetical protein